MLRRATGTRIVLSCVGAVLASGAVASGATAGPLVDEVGRCEPQQLLQPFARWADPLQYTPVRDGGIEHRGERWKLHRVAAPVPGNEPWNVAGEDDDRSLSLPAGSSATTPAICVGVAEPTLRFFARSTDGLVAKLQVDVLYEDAVGGVHALPIGTDSGGRWHPTAPMPVVANLLPLLPGEQTPVSFRFTAVGDARFEIDDVYVDPWCMR
jgi:hypothetical protein